MASPAPTCQHVTMPLLTESSLVFLSHNRKDKPFSRRLAAGLAAHGISVWFDEWRIELGQSITGRISDGLATCTDFLLMWSSAAANSPWVARELEAGLYAAVSAGKRIIPLCRDDTPLPALIADVKGLRVRTLGHALDELVGPEGAERALRETIIALNARRTELLSRDTGPVGYRCDKCGSKRVVETGGPVGHDDWITVIECQDCGEILGDCV